MKFEAKIVSPKIENCVGKAYQKVGMAYLHLTAK